MAYYGEKKYRDMAYYGEKKYRGMAVVIGNEKFDTRGKEPNIDRPGCVEDLKMMKQMFERLDFFVMCYKDLTKQQMEQKIKQASKDQRHADCECFVLVLSSHGYETLDKKAKVPLWRHGVMGTDRELVVVDDILEMFDEKNATNLAGKPKLFFIQACRVKVPPPKFSYTMDAGVPARLPETSPYADEKLPDELYNDISYIECEDLYTDWNKDPDCWSLREKKQSGSQETGGDATSGGASGGDAGRSPDTDELPPETVQVLSIKCPEDCLLYYPVVSGKSAFRTDDERGSIMMIKLWYLLPKLLRGVSFQKYLTFVNRAMSEHIVTVHKIEKCRMTASVVHRMTKHIRFVPKSDDSKMAKAMKITGLQ